MNDLQIDYFLAVARNLSFTKTAEEFYVTQPAVSRHISFLEKELGVALFDRAYKSTTLTEAGKLFQKYFIESRKALEQTKDKAKNLNSTKKGVVRLGCLEGWNISGFFPKLMQLFAANYPNIEISLETYGVRGLKQALKTGKADVILTLGVTISKDPAIQSADLARVPQVLLFSSHHPEAGRPDLKPSDFQKDRFLVLSENEASYAADLVRGECETYGFTPDISYVRSIESMFSNVQNNLGVCICDKWARVLNNPDFQYLELDARHQICLAWDQDCSNEAVGILVNELTFLVSSQEPVIVG